MKILKTNQSLKLVDNNVEVHDDLPVGIYTLEYNGMTGEFYLSQQNFDKFKVPTKLYGNITTVVDRIVSTYRRRDNKLGVLLHGEKGTGKSIISKMVINALGIPVIMIKDFYENSSAMESFFNELKVPVVIFVDEFEKIYRHEEQQAKLLSIMDGTGQSDILFLLTSNSNERVSGYLKNRPGRIYYSIRFDGLEKEVIEDVINDMLTDPIKIEIIKRACVIVGSINYDLLTAMIDEINNNDVKDVNELMYYLNVEPSEARYDGYAFLKENMDIVYTEFYQSNPLVSGVRIEGYATSAKTGKSIPEGEVERLGIELYSNIRAVITDCTDLVITPESITFENEDYKFVYKQVRIRRLVF